MHNYSIHSDVRLDVCGFQNVNFIFQPVIVVGMLMHAFIHIGVCACVCGIIFDRTRSERLYQSLANRIAGWVWLCAYGYYACVWK